MAEALDDALRRILARAHAAVADDSEIRRFEAEQQARMRGERLEASGISERLDVQGAAAIVRDRPRRTRALELVQAWVLSSRPVLVLTGKPGLGKTVAAAWALARLPGRYVCAGEMCELWASKRDRDRDRFFQLLRTELLVIDELGQESSADDARAMLQDAIDRRQRLPRRTMLLTNLGRAEIIARYDARTLSRLGVEADEHGIALFRHLKGTDLRSQR